MTMVNPFIASYKSKFEKRKLQFMSQFGTVELVMDKRHTFSVNTLQASILFGLEQN